MQIGFIRQEQMTIKAFWALLIYLKSINKTTLY